MCPACDMPSLGASTWPCCPLETTLPEFGQPHWLATAPGQTVSLSTSLAQVCRASVPDLYSQTAPPGSPDTSPIVETTGPSTPSLLHPHLPLWKEKCLLSSDFSIFFYYYCFFLFFLTSPSLTQPSAAFWPPEEEDSGGLHVLLTVTPVGLMLLIILAALGFFYSRKR